PQYPIFHQAIFGLKAFPAEDVEAALDLRLRYYDFTAVSEFAEMSESESIQPWEFLLWEAYLDLYAFGSEDIDVRIGKQRIAWVRADRLNPTDNLNPDDFSDFLNFGEKVPSWAIKADWTIIEERLKLTAVWLPSPLPVTMPRYAALPLGDGSLELPPGISVVETSTTLSNRKYDLEHSMQALKLGGTLSSINWSLSYFHGYDDLPLAKSVLITPLSLTELRVDTEMKLPEVHIIGADFAGELLSVGWWAEVATTIPAREERLAVTHPFTGTPITTEEVSLASDPYTKYTLGLDYTFSGGTYLNLQYSHGFFTERGVDGLHEYAMIRVDHKFLDGELKVALGGLVETPNFEEMADNYGISIFPEVIWKPRDNVDFILGWFYLDGKGESLFGSFKEDDQAYLKVKVAY
ncbi:hypothetical protein KAI87_15585, partial [Myxococcota bacterium]|nr:hypothetical protein [Myxococcota bacterium]